MIPVVPFQEKDTSI
jgi:hypothetical protein